MERPATPNETKFNEAILEKKVKLKMSEREILVEYFNELYRAWKRNIALKSFWERQQIVNQNPQIQQLIETLKLEIGREKDIMEYLLEKL